LHLFRKKKGAVNAIWYSSTFSLAKVVTVWLTDWHWLGLTLLQTMQSQCVQPSPSITSIGQADSKNRFGEYSIALHFILEFLSFWLLCRRRARLALQNIK